MISENLLKDLNRVTEDEILKTLQEQEAESQIKKEKKLRQINKNLDYTLREYRKRTRKRTGKGNKK